MRAIAEFFQTGHAPVERGRDHRDVRVHDGCPIEQRAGRRGSALQEVPQVIGRKRDTSIMQKATRRTFLKRSCLAAGTTALTAASYARVLGANDDIRVAVVGFHGQGSVHLGCLRGLPGVRLAATLRCRPGGARPRAEGGQGRP